MEKFKIETDRLVIRTLVAEDYEAWYQGFEGRKVSQHAFDDGQLDMSVCDLKWFQQLVTRHQELWEKDDTYIFAIFDKKGQHLGMLNITTLARTNMQWGELGYFIHNQHWRKGFAYEALSALVEASWKELGFHRLEAQISPGNRASQQLAEKLGFVYECRRPKFAFEDGQWVDQDIYSRNLHEQPLD
ncbi:acetyltransferase, GNAT family [Streptococcus porcinus]|uniref:GNAT family N-acetyltransferase n=1 Tax=Streptococcus porcinus TaxID=1340 RepID=UPI0010CAB52B|nr:GNAT family N-acetyltransferase [Streptococcus porcinus]VTS47311.1 acetyltransferase, GNAT family [Streptococcus porcinus]